MLDGKQGDLVRNSVYQKLRSDVLSCALRPGQMLQEKELVDRFSVSRSPIRDALLKLEEQGLVEVMPRKGYRVRRIDLSDVRDMYSVRHMLERETVSMMIETASDDVMEGLEAFRTLERAPDLGQWISYNRNFHLYIALNCGNARLARLSQDMIEEFDRLTYVSVTSSSDLSLDVFVREHGGIIDALKARNKRQAISQAKDHIERSRRRVMNSLETFSVVDTNPETR
ncbi:GntR family transcriptional regulator [Pelagibacterium montanilacus]|uniref:GntR family transcriptional regulator n=1 Tax=Pelagibacterium montanilacus TaxID=2185280 RepID=UPI000F8ED529|nr:GntR family transcriptional regulator [Pelagibacterium montanilacus]